MKLNVSMKEIAEICVTLAYTALICLLLGAVAILFVAIDGNWGMIFLTTPMTDEALERILRGLAGAGALAAGGWIQLGLMLLYRKVIYKHEERVL